MQTIINYHIGNMESLFMTQIEQKSIDKSLTAPIRQSDGSLLNP